MSSTTGVSTQGISQRVRDAAEKLRRHIRSCGLQPGDRYISADEAGTLLGESVMTAQRAMAFLASEDVLDRRAGTGTFIGPAAAGHAVTSCIQYFLPEQCIFERTMREGYWECLQGMREVLPNVSVQSNFVRDQDDAHVKQLIEQASVNALAGVVLVLSTRAIRSYFNQSGIPTVVRGNVEPGLTNLCWISYDEGQVGQLLTSWLVQRGHRRLVTIMRDVWSIGEHQLIDSAGKVLSDAGLAADSLLVRSTPSDPIAIEEVVRQLLTDTDDIPTGFICRNAVQADGVTEVARSLGLADRIDVTLANIADDLIKPHYTCVEPEIDEVEQGRITARMFQTMSEARMPEPRGHTVGVKLRPLDA
jgi:DNA-binding LacI/PurR family transcriptional regulator